MNRQALAPIPLWMSVVHGVTLAISLVVIAYPAARAPPMRVVLSVLFLFGCLRMFWRERQLLRLPLNLLHRHLPLRRSFAESFAVISLVVSALTQVFAF